MKKISMLVIISILAIIMFNKTAYSQTLDNNLQPLIPAPKGVYVLNYDPDAATKQAKLLLYVNVEKYIVYRIANSEEPKQIAEVSLPKSYNAFENVYGKTEADNFKQQNKIKSNDEAYEAIKNFDIKKLGIFILDKKFLQAIGMIYFDEFAYTNNTKYKVVAVYKTGTKTDVFTKSVSEFPISEIAKVKMVKTVLSDSLISLRWNIDNKGAGFFGRVYKQQDNQKEFLPVKYDVIKGKDDKTGGNYFFYADKVTPGHVYNYFIIPSDFAGNLGKPSDTTLAISANPNSIKAIHNIKGTDSLNQIFLKWTALPKYAYYTGIEISKSRKSDNDFVVLDTIPATDSTYFDKKVISNSLYYYQVKALVFPFPGFKALPASKTTVSIINKTVKPLAPNNLTAQQKEKDILLNWQPNIEPDIFGYYVLRGTSLQNLEIISGILKDTTYLDNSKTLTGRNQYVYAVKAINQGQLVSDASNQTIVVPNRAEVLPIIGGVSAIATPLGAQITWEDLKDKYNGIIGYNVYRKTTTETTYKLINETPVTYFKYLDVSAIKPEQTYEYAISVVDAWQKISDKSNAVKLTIEKKIPAAPPILYTSKAAKSILVTWPQTTTQGIKYAVYRKEIGAKDFIKIANVTTEQFNDVTAKPNILYVYTVASILNNIEGKKSDEFTARLN